MINPVDSLSVPMCSDLFRFVKLALTGESLSPLLIDLTSYIVEGGWPSFLIAEAFLFKSIVDNS